MLKTRRFSIETILTQCIGTAVFPSELKKGNIVPNNKKETNTKLSIYRLVSLLSICGKILERLLLNEMFMLFIENNLVLSNQSSFKPGDSCINQLLYITH